MFGATKSGLGNEFYGRELALRNEGWEEDDCWDVPRTVPQGVSIMRENSEYSYIVIVHYDSVRI